MKFARPLAFGRVRSLFWPVSCSVSCSLYLCTWYTHAKRRRPGAMAHKNRTPGGPSLASSRLQAATWADFSDFLGHWRRIKNPCIFCIAPKGQKSKNQWPLVASRSDFGSIFNDFGRHFGIDFSIFLRLRFGIDFSWVLHRIPKRFHLKKNEKVL